jgi:LPS-assembly protein
MPLSRHLTFLLFFLLTLFFAKNSLAVLPLKKITAQSAPAVLKADEVYGDKDSNKLFAEGNVEIAKGESVVYANQMVYEKDDKTVRAIGNVRIKNIEIGIVKASEASIKDDFSSGVFLNTKMFFIDGSYLISPQITRRNPLVTVLKNSIFSICPNPNISSDSDLAGKERDLISIKSRQTTIDREKQKMTSNEVLIRFYNVPFLYTPYISLPLPSNKKQSGFLNPSYAKSTNLGLGIKIPYYFDIAPNIDLTTTPLIGVGNNQILIDNEFRHKTSFGDYKINFEIANNKIKNTNNSTVVSRTQNQYRWNFSGEGKFDLTKNVGLDFKTNLVSDRDYLRDYHFSYLNYTLSKVNLDYINGRDYHAAKLIKIQELENSSNQYFAPLVVPQIDSHIESKPKSLREKFALTSNVSVIARQEGLQYRRATTIPEFNIPLNLQGNLFNFNSKLQTDFYSLENNFKSTSATNNYEQFASNYKPEASLSWRLPLIKKTKFNTLLVEPMANLVVSSYKKNFNALPNQDSNNSELSVSNLFVADRISGFDRNESGKRFNYGVKTSMFNKYGEFGLTIGQGYKKGKEQDVLIQGFNNNNKSNLVGQAIYKAAKYFSATYSFQLNESNYRNDVNQLSSSLNFNRVQFSSDFLLVRRTNQNLNEKKQLSLSSRVLLNKEWSATIFSNKDLVLNRTLSRGISLTRDGCCAIFGFSITETNPSSLVKPQQSFNLSLLFKNL